MALKKTLPNDEHLYAVVSRIEASKQSLWSFIVTIYKKNQAGDTLDIDLIRFQMGDTYQELTAESLSADGMNPYRALYLWLKQNKPMFQGWEDC